MTIVMGESVGNYEDESGWVQWEIFGNGKKELLRKFSGFQAMNFGI